MARSKKSTSETKDADDKADASGEEIGTSAPKADETLDAAGETIEDAEFTDLPDENAKPRAEPVEEVESDKVDLNTAEVSTEAAETGAEKDAVEPAANDTDPTATDDVLPSDEAPAAVAVVAPPPKPASAMAGMVPLIFGGLVAGAIGFFAGRYYDEFNAPEVAGPTPAENAATLTSQSERFDGIEATLADVASRDIGSEIAEAVDPLNVAVTDISTRVDGLTGALSTLSERVETIALRPTATGIEADEFDGALADFRTQLQGTIDQAQAEIDKARSEAEAISEQAFAAEQGALIRSTWSEIETALESGAPYRESLDALQSMLEAPVPEPLVANADDGISQLSALQRSFPGAARAALDASIRSTSSEGDAVDKLTSFLRVQAGVRSLAPREGDDPDAVLSRAEAALGSGDVAATLDEIKALPEAGQSALSEWADAATTRLDVLGAASDFASTLQ